MRFLRRKQASVEETLPLSLTGEDGENWVTFPPRAVEAVRQAIARIVRTGAFPEKLVITSAVRQEGVTYLSRAVGAVLAGDFDRKICVVELNWWWPADNPAAVSGRPGAAEVLMGQATLAEALAPTGMENLSLLPAGKLPHHRRSHFTNSEELAALIATLEGQFDHLILDIPAVTATSDSILLASLGTALCLVINQGVTPIQRVKAALDDLDHLNIIGVLMNQVTVTTPGFLLNYIPQE